MALALRLGLRGLLLPLDQVDTPDGERRLVPPSGHVAGIYAKCDRQEGVFRAPANEELKGVVDLARNLFDTDVGQLNAEGVNCLRASRVAGFASGVHARCRATPSGAMSTFGGS